MSIYYNKKRLEGSRFREGNKVYLIRRNIRIIRLSNKLDYRKFELFKIIRYIIISLFTQSSHFLAYRGNSK
jgi:hypothetical protein